MNELMVRLMRQHVPPMNPDVMNGLATKHMEQVEEYNHRVNTGLNKALGEHELEYTGFKRCTPEEEYFEATKVRNNKRTYDLAKTDIYLIKTQYNFRGEPIPDRFVYLPFVRDAGVMYISGSMYHMSPVLSDPVISPEAHSIFVRLLSSKVKFFRVYHTMMVNGQRKTTQICWAPIYRKPQEKRKIVATTKANSTAAHYLFAKFGFEETFRRYAGHIPVVGEGEINERTHPRDKWMVCESSATYTHLKPTTFVGEYYTPTKLQLAIPIDKWTPEMSSLVEGFFYVVDHFPDQLKAEYLSHNNLWVILLGHILFSGNYSASKLYSSIMEHFNSLDNCVDPIIIEKLHADNYKVDNFYDLMAMIMGNWNELVTKRGRSRYSMYGKTLETLYYALYPITSSMFTTIFKLNKFAQKKRPEKKDIIELFNRNFRVRAVFDLAAGSIVTESVSYSGDHKYFKLTSRLASQENWTGKGRGSKTRTVIGPEHHVDASQIECGNLLFLSKSSPSPMSKLNPWAMINDSNSTLIRNPKLIDVLDRTQVLLEKK